MSGFTPVSALAGGVLIGFGTLALMALNGRIAGISGIVSGLLPPAPAGDKSWRLAFVGGLVASVFVFMFFAGSAVQQSVSGNLFLMSAAGLFVGFGTALGGGCTSGHGVCGISRLSVRSIVATCVFMSTAALTVFIMRHVIGG